MLDQQRIIQELQFKTARSGGAGGQHVNKVESKVILSWDVQQSQALESEEKSRILQALQNRINKEGLLQLESSETRSQFENKELVVKRFFNLIVDALKPIKQRRKTKIPKSKILERLDRKKKLSKKKNARKWDWNKGGE